MCGRDERIRQGVDRRVFNYRDIFVFSNGFDSNWVAVLKMVITFFNLMDTNIIEIELPVCDSIYRIIGTRPQRRADGPVSGVNIL